MINWFVPLTTKPGDIVINWFEPLTTKPGDNGVDWRHWGRLDCTTYHYKPEDIGIGLSVPLPLSLETFGWIGLFFLPLSLGQLS